jgi:hypothetical protein
MGKLINDIKFLNCELINLVEDVNARDISTVSFNNINKLIDCGIAAAKHVSTHDLILTTNGVHQLVRENGLWDHCLKVNGSFLFAPA